MRDNLSRASIQNGAYQELLDDLLDRIHNVRVRDAIVQRPAGQFFKSARVEEIKKNGNVLTLERCVGAEAAEDDRKPFEEKTRRLVVQLHQQQIDTAQSDAAITDYLGELGYGM